MPQPETLPEVHRDYERGEISTLYGGRFDYESPELVDIRDIAHGLAAQSRYNGLTPKPYSIAQHSIVCARLVASWGEGQTAQRAALMHDAAEAYCGDLPHPLKERLPEYNRISEKVEKVIAEKFSYPHPHPAAVQKADWVVYAYERQTVSEHKDLEVEGANPPESVQDLLSSCWGFDRARREFVDMFYALS